MKNLKVKLSVLAIVLGMGGAFATTAHHSFSNKRWGQLSGTWVDVTGETKGTDYFCTGSINTCTAEFPSDVDPNNQAGDSHPGTVQPTNIVLGNFSN